MYQGGDLLVAQSPMTMGEWVAAREKENAESAGPQEDVWVTPEDNGKRPVDPTAIPLGAAAGFDQRLLRLAELGWLRLAGP